MANLLRDRWTQFSKEQKVAITALTVCCLFLLLGGISQIRSYVRKPFLVSRQNLTKSIQILTQNTQDDQKIMDDQKLKDTDRDGLSDYDELYVYHTSPYLVDSDSDGIPDGDEIARNSDPNCPEGKNCADVQSSVPTVNTSTFATDFQASANNNLLAAQAAAQAADKTGVNDFIAHPAEPSSMNAEQTRAYLLAHQLITQDQLKGLPDAAVLQAYQLSYQDALRVRAAQAAASAPPGQLSSSTLSTIGSGGPTPSQPSP